MINPTIEDINGIAKEPPNISQKLLIYVIKSGIRPTIDDTRAKIM